MRRALFQVHLWTGMAAGLYVLVVCLTGAALVFRIDLQRAMDPDLFTPSAGGPPSDAATVLERVRDAYPGDRVSGIEAPTTTRPTSLAYVMRGDRFLTLLVDPTAGRVLGELPDRPLIRALQDLHFSLLAGRTGRIVNGAGAVCLLLMCLTGVAVWWPGLRGWTRGFTVRTDRGWKPALRDLHGLVGILSVAMIAMWAVTGLAFVFPSAFRASVSVLSPTSVSRTPTSNTAAATAPPTWRSLIDTARRRVPDQHVARIVVPSSDRAAFLVMFSKTRPTPAGSPDLTSIYLDQYTGAVLRDASSARTRGDAIVAWAAPLHVGNFAGTGVRVLWFVFALAPPALAVTGLVVWWSRRRPRQPFMG